MPEVYSIVIPTRERPDTLHHTLKTVCALPQQNVEIIVMDNFGTEATRNVVRRFQDKRIKYFRSKSRLSMSDNFECGLQNVTGDYVLFLGDDDGILPDAIELAMILHGWHRGKIISWKPVIWMWPNSTIREFRNVMNMHLSHRIELRDSLKAIERFYNYEVNYRELPMVSNSIVPITLIREFIKRHGRFFFDPCSDVYSGIVIGYLADQILYSYRPLSVWGLSKHSTGVSYSFDQVAGEAARRYREENKQTFSEPMHKLLVDSHMTEIGIADTMLKTQDKFFPGNIDVRMNIPALVRELCQGAPRYKIGSEKVVENILAIALKNNVAPTEYTLPTKFPGPQKLINNYSIEMKRDLVCFSFSTNPSIYPAIDRIVGLVSELIVPSTSLPVVLEKSEGDTSSGATPHGAAPITDKIDPRNPGTKGYAVLQHRLSEGPEQGSQWKLQDYCSNQIVVRKPERKTNLRRVARKVINLLGHK